LLTGKYPHRNGMVANDLRLRESEATLAKLLKEEGFQTGFIGKWHLDGGRRDPGFVPPGLESIRQSRAKSLQGFAAEG
jgi:arylsulfatase A-like enzyme